MNEQQSAENDGLDAARRDGARQALEDHERTVGMSGFRFSSREDHAEALAMIREARAGVIPPAKGVTP
jgi:hypothetical protein